MKRFGGTANHVVAEQVLKACLILPAEPEFLARLGNLESLLIAAGSRYPAVIRTRNQPRRLARFCHGPDEIPPRPP